MDGINKIYGSSFNYFFMAAQEWNQSRAQLSPDRDIDRYASHRDRLPEELGQRRVEDQIVLLCAECF